MGQPRGAALVVVVGLFLVGCARSAPELPIDTHGKSPEEATRLLNISDADKQLDCGQIKHEKAMLSLQYSSQNATIESHRTHNQVAGYFGTFFPPAYLAANHNSEAKDKLDDIQVRFDQLYFLKYLNNCP